MPSGIPANGVRRTKSWLRRNGYIKPESLESLEKEDTSLRAETDAEKFLSDEQITERIKCRFDVMDRMVEATVLGINRSLIVSGPAGLGKSFGVTSVTERLEETTKSTFVRGFVRPTGLFKILHESRFEDQCVIFDDADSIFNDDVALNLLKAACDMTGKRHLSWFSERSMVDEFGTQIDKTFEFKGSIIFITNYDFDTMMKKGHRYAPHFDALISRSHYLDLALKTRRDYTLRIKDVVIRHGMLSKMGLNAIEALDVLQFIEENVDILRSLNLRAALKIANLMKMNSDNWREMAKITCCIEP